MKKTLIFLALLSVSSILKADIDHFNAEQSKESEKGRIIGSIIGTGVGLGVGGVLHEAHKDMFDVEKPPSPLYIIIPPVLGWMFGYKMGYNFYDKKEKFSKKGRIIGTIIGTGIGLGVAYVYLVGLALSGGLSASPPSETSSSKFLSIIIPPVLGGIIGYGIGEVWDKEVKFWIKKSKKEEKRDED